MNVLMFEYNCIKKGNSKLYHFALVYYFYPKTKQVKEYIKPRGLSVLDDVG